MSSVTNVVVNILLLVHNGKDRDEINSKNTIIILVIITVDLMIRAWVTVIYNVIIDIVNISAPGSPFPDVPAGVCFDCLLPRRREDQGRERLQGLCQRRRQGGELLLSW